MLLGCVQMWFLTGLAERYPNLAQHNPRYAPPPPLPQPTQTQRAGRGCSGGFSSWLALTTVPILLLFIGFGTWDSLTCAKNPDDNQWSTECAEDASTFTFVAGCILILTSITVTQVSNRGFLATWVLPVLTLIIFVWTIAAENPFRMLVLTAMAALVSGIACFSGSGSSARWSEATSTSLSFSILALQAILFLVTLNPTDFPYLTKFPTDSADITFIGAVQHIQGPSGSNRWQQPNIRMECPPGSAIVWGNITGTCCTSACEVGARTCSCDRCTVDLPSYERTAESLSWDSEMGCREVVESALDFFANVTTVLWLTQFLFLPAIIFDRASFPGLAVMMGAGLLPVGGTYVSLAITMAVGVVLIFVTPPETDDLMNQQAISQLTVQGFDFEAPLLAADEQPENPNRNRLVMCTGLTPIVALMYLVSSWRVVVGDKMNGVPEDEASESAYISALTLAAPVLLGMAQLQRHRISPSIAINSIVACVLLTPGAWMYDGLSLIFSLIWFVLLTWARLRIRNRDDDEERPPSATMQGLHAGSAVALGAFLILHRLSMHWLQPWAYTVGYYIFCFEPLSDTAGRIKTPSYVDAGIVGMRMMRPGLWGTFFLAIPATFWTIRDEQYICSDPDWSKGDCDESGTYQLCMLLPIIIILLEWACTEICVLKSDLDVAVKVSTQQLARTLALVLFALVALPFRATLFAAEDVGKSQLEARYNVQTAAFDANPLNQSTNACRASGYYADSPRPDWCDMIPLEVEARRHAGIIFTVLLCSAPVLLTIMCFVLSAKFSDAAAPPVNDVPHVMDYVSKVPPTQAMSYAVLLMSLRLFERLW